MCTARKGICRKASSAPRPPSSCPSPRPPHSPAAPCLPEPPPLCRSRWQRLPPMPPAQPPPQGPPQLPLLLGLRRHLLAAAHGTPGCSTPVEVDVGEGCVPNWEEARCQPGPLRRAALAHRCPPHPPYQHQHYASAAPSSPSTQPPCQHPAQQLPGPLPRPAPSSRMKHPPRRSQ